MQNYFSAVLCALLAFAVTGCASGKNIAPFPSVSADARRELEQAPNCATAKQDIAILEDEKASVGRQMFKGVQSIMPISVVAGILMGDYNDRVGVATGRYNEDIERKIGQIHRACGV